MGGGGGGGRVVDCSRNEIADNGKERGRGGGSLG